MLVRYMVPYTEYSVLQWGARRANNGRSTTRLFKLPCQGTPCTYPDKTNRYVSRYR